MSAPDVAVVTSRLNVSSKNNTIGEADLQSAVEALPGAVLAGHQVLDVVFCGRTRDLWTKELQGAIDEVRGLIDSLNSDGKINEADSLTQMLIKMNQALAIEQQRLRLGGSARGVDGTLLYQPPNLIILDPLFEVYGTRHEDAAVVELRALRGQVARGNDDVKTLCIKLDELAAGFSNQDKPVLAAQTLKAAAALRQQAGHDGSGRVQDRRQQAAMTLLAQLRMSMEEMKPPPAASLDQLQEIEFDLSESEAGWELSEVGVAAEHLSQQLVNGDSTAPVISLAQKLAAEVIQLAELKSDEDEAAAKHARFDSVDTNKDGTLSRTEFLRALEEETIALNAGGDAWYSGDPGEAMLQALVLCKLVVASLQDRESGLSREEQILRLCSEPMYITS